MWCGVRVVCMCVCVCVYVCVRVRVCFPLPGQCFCALVPL